jgi:DNA polymerase-3 subunit delta'
MPMHSLVGHEGGRRHIEAAIRQGRLPQLLLLTGPEGVGKQRFALWVAQRLFCTADKDQPCGVCSQCRMVLGLGHPDLHWLIPVPRPKSSEADKQVEELEEAIGEILEGRRKNSLYGRPDGMSSHFVSTARLILRRAAMRPSQGAVKVFIIGYAERLVPQESSPEAANALLKLLEEPTPDTYFILTAADHEGVLPTIRSRAARLRLAPLEDSAIRRFLADRAESIPAADLEHRVTLARGAIGAALDDQTEAVKSSQAALALLESARDRSKSLWEMTIKQTPFSARGEFTGTLDAMALLLSQAAREATKGSLETGLAVIPPAKLVAALERVGEAREMAQNNVNPQVLLAVLTQDLAEML